LHIDKNNSQMSLMMEADIYVNHFWTPTGRFEEFECKQQSKDIINSSSPVNQIFRSLIFQTMNPLFEETPLAMKIPIQARRMIAELTMLSFTEQTYGVKGAFKIIKDMDKGRTRTFNLIDKLKLKVFPTDNLKLHLNTSEILLSQSHLNEQ
jgi:hypothetical protein